jgi:UDP-N-acetylglucosamine transferase subunit ALG13
MNLVLVTVGTDHHPFGRIVDWASDYVASKPAQSVEFVCQHGTAAPPVVGRHDAFVDHESLQGLMRRATAVVCHGGPSTMLESLRLGRMPIVVPRRQQWGEAVDDHQLEFSRFLLSCHQVVVAETEAQLRAALDRALADPDAFAAPPAPPSWVPPSAAVQRFSDFARQLPPRRRGRLLLR